MHRTPPPVLPAAEPGLVHTLHRAPGQVLRPPLQRLCRLSSLAAALVAAGCANLGGGTAGTTTAAAKPPAQAQAAAPGASAPKLAPKPAAPTAGASSPRAAAAPGPAASAPRTALAGANTPPKPPAGPASGPGITPRPPGVAAPTAATTPPPGAQPPGAPVPGQLPPFAVVSKDYTEVKGLFSAWRKDERTLLELKPTDFEKPFFLSPKLARGLGEQWIYGGLMLPSANLVQWKRVHNTVQLMAINTRQVAAANSPESRAVRDALPPSLLSSVPVVSAAHPERKSVLIDASAIFVSDMLGVASALQRTFRQGYSLEPRNSLIAEVRGKPDLTVIEVTAHYATGSISLPVPGAPPGLPLPTLPRGLADPRSMLLGLHYSLARLPDQPMARRPADPRVGYFLSSTDDFSDDLARSPRQRYVNRWRLEKKDPAAEVSEPVKPITYWIDRNVPVKYRDTIREGILEWNKAFNRIGFSNAIVVQQQPDDATWDTLDADVASVRWMMNREPSFGAIGPSHVDPRTGEILDADIGIESLSSRSVRNLRARVEPGPAPAGGFGAAGLQSAGAGAGAAAVGSADSSFTRDLPELLQFARPMWPAGAEAHDPRLCRHGDHAAEQMGYGLDLLMARDQLPADSPEAEAFVRAYLKDTTMHEVGHTLGLRHNFRASHVYSDRQVRDPDSSKRQAFTGSVMEYAPINLARPGEPAPSPFQTTLGPYDLWAIEYAYKPLAPGNEAEQLAAIAGRSGEPELAYATDEDNFFGIDPDALHFDLGDDPVAFAERRFDIAADLFKRQETRRLLPNEDFAALRRSLLYAVRDASRASGVVLRQIGGLRTLRDYANTGRDPLQPVPAEAQRAALKLLTDRVLAAGSFALSPALQRRLAPDYFERAEGVMGMSTEFSLADNVLDLQRALLNLMMGDGLARRVLDNEGRFEKRAESFRLAELYQRLDQAIWSELASGSDIPPERRNLQREHVNRLAVVLQRPAIMGRADARALARGQGEQLLTRLDRGLARPGLSVEARLHLKDSAESLRQVLRATVDRGSP